MKATIFVDSKQENGEWKFRLDEVMKFQVEDIAAIGTHEDTTFIKLKNGAIYYTREYITFDTL